MLSNESFEVRYSLVECAGEGLFSLINIKSNETIGEYKGFILTDNELENSPFNASDYILCVCKDHNIIGEGPLANHTRYINHHDEPNCEIVSSTRWKKARIRAIKSIKPGQELYIDYGEEYWEII